MPREILMIEDSPSDASLAMVAVEETGFDVHLRVVDDGIEALAYLRQEGRYRNVPRPDVVLLDLNLPGVDGRQLLRVIREDPRLHLLPVIVLTTSSDELDVTRCYQLGANGYVVKPLDFEGFVDAVRTIERFWLRVAKLPPQQD